MSQHYLLFEEAGQFKTGTILQDTGASLQVEITSGKRVKVKQSNVMLRFGSPGPAEMLAQAMQEAESIDIDFLWEVAPQEEFDYQLLVTEYYGENASVVQQTAMLMRLHGTPVYFYRKGRGRYRPAQPDTLKAALAAIERKHRQEAEIQTLADELAAGSFPAVLTGHVPDLLVAADRQSVVWRALDLACQQTGLSPERLLLNVGALADARAVHEQRFLRSHFPAGTGFPAALAQYQPPDLGHLPESPVEAFSIDDASTTEIDDCLSVQWLGDGIARVGVHIAAPALGIRPGDAVDHVARERMTTVYSPGAKITMLPESVVRSFSLDEGQVRPALSLYLDINIATLQVANEFSQVDRIRVARNIRHDDLIPYDQEAFLESQPADGEPDPLAGLPFADAFRLLWRLTLSLSAERDKVRGRPELRSRVDFTFRIDGDHVDILPRRRDAPFDRIVAEMAILANSRWGRLLADHAVSGLYRSQSFGRVKMSTHPAIHQGLGVPQYAWSTSPLRRYVDLINQMQLVAVLEAEVPPFTMNDTSLYAIVSAFEARYGTVNEYQQTMERYWCLRWMAQQPEKRFQAVAIRDETVRLAAAPLYFQVMGLPPMSAGQPLLVDVLAWDELDLTVQAHAVRLIANPDDSDPVGAEAMPAPQMPSTVSADSTDTE
ncbi:MAG: RNB domain-containing ribonuclease [Lautropia sp.]|nr:RNB domain-containing ribonuclease [Lautropia sp.]